jgi:hypothetical protein
MSACVARRAISSAAGDFASCRASSATRAARRTSRGLRPSASVSLASARSSLRASGARASTATTPMSRFEAASARSRMRSESWPSSLRSPARAARRTASSLACSSGSSSLTARGLPEAPSSSVARTLRPWSSSLLTRAASSSSDLASFQPARARRDASRSLGSRRLSSYSAQVWAPWNSWTRSPTLPPASTGNTRRVWSSQAATRQGRPLSSARVSAAIFARPSFWVEGRR